MSIKIKIKLFKNKYKKSYNKELNDFLYIFNKEDIDFIFNNENILIDLIDFMVKNNSNISFIYAPFIDPYISSLYNISKNYNKKITFFTIKNNLSFNNLNILIKYNEKNKISNLNNYIDSLKKITNINKNIKIEELHFNQNIILNQIITDIINYFKYTESKKDFYMSDIEIYNIEKKLASF